MNRVCPSFFLPFSSSAWTFLVILKLINFENRGTVIVLFHINNIDIVTLAYISYTHISYLLRLRKKCKEKLEICVNQYLNIVKKKKKKKRKHKSCFMCHMSCVTCHVLHVSLTPTAAATDPPPLSTLGWSTVGWLKN